MVDMALRRIDNSSFSMNGTGETSPTTLKHDVMFSKLISSCILCIVTIITIVIHDSGRKAIIVRSTQPRAKTIGTKLSVHVTLKTRVEVRACLIGKLKMKTETK